MKYLILSVITTIVLGLFAFKGIEADVKSQNEELKNMQLGNYTVYLTHKKEDGSYMGGIADYSLKLISVEPDKVYPEKTHEVKLHRTWRESGKVEKNWLYLASNFGDFTATYQADSYEGNKEFRDVYGYLPRSFVGTRNEVEDKRVVFLDGRMYFIEDWKSKDDYTLVAVAEAGTDPKGFKLVKAVFKTPKKMKALDPDKKLKDYLDAAYPKQEQSKTSSQLLAKFKKLKTDWDSFVNNQNSMYFKNSTGKDIYIYSYDSTEAGLLKAGETKKYVCGSEYYYDFTGKRFYYPNKVKQISTRGKYDKCADKMGGKPYEIK